jgi:hypothetical protein
MDDKENHSWIPTFNMQTLAVIVKVNVLLPSPQTSHRWLRS